MRRWECGSDSDSGSGSDSYRDGWIGNEPLLLRRTVWWVQRCPNATASILLPFACRVRLPQLDVVLSSLCECVE